MCGALLAKTDSGCGNPLSALQDGGTDVHLQEIVLSGGGQRFTHVEVVLDEHIGCASHVDSVEVDIGKAVDAAEVQEEIVLLCIIRAIEMPAVPPLVSLPLAEEVHVVPKFRLLDESGRQQIQFYVAGYGGRDGVEWDACHAFGGGDGRFSLLPEIQGPGAVQRKTIGPGRRKRSYCEPGGKEGCEYRMFQRLK